MGNAIGCALPQTPSKNVVKLVHCNGLVDEFYRPVLVGELTPDYPHHFICHSRSLLSFFNIAAHPPLPAHPLCPPPPASLPALPDHHPMQLGQIYFLLPLHSPFSSPAIASLFSKAPIARKASYKDIQVASFSDQMQDSPDSLHAPISQDFFKRLLAETRLQLPSDISGRFLISPLQNQLVLPSASAASSGRLSDLELESSVSSSQSGFMSTINREPWRPPLETIIEEGNLFIT